MRRSSSVPASTRSRVGTVSMPWCHDMARSASWVAGTPSGKIFRLRGKGVPFLGTNRRGDQHVKVKVKVPTKVSPEHKALLEKLRQYEGKDGEGEQKGFFDKMKDMFV